MGSPEKEHHASGDSSIPRRRSLYRQGSLSSAASGMDGIVLQPLADGERHSIRSHRQRTPSGKSIRSRTASRAEYHADLRQDMATGLTKNLCLTAFTVYFGSSFLFGYNIGVLNQPELLIKDFYNSSYSERNGEISKGALTFLWSLTTAMFLPGGMIGAFSAGYLADKLGRKRAILLSHIFAFIGAVVSTCCLVANTPELLMVGRFITGINCGLGSQLPAMFVSEITPFNLRGAFGTGHQLFITIGILMGSIFGLRQLLGTADLWPYLLLLNAGPALLSLIILPFLPESPRYLMITRGKHEEAEAALKWYRQQEDVSADMEEMETESTEKTDNEDEKDNSYTMMDLFKDQNLRMPLLVACFLQVIQQLSGINAIFFYSGGIYKAAGVVVENIQYAVVGTNAVNVLMTFVAVPVMDKAGRRPLLLYPMIVMVFTLITITIALTLQTVYKIAPKEMSYLAIFCVIVYVIAFAVGLGPIPMMVGSELFRQGPRPRVVSLAGLTNWIFTFIVAISFPSIQGAIGSYTFIVFLVLMAFFTVFVFFKVPETKNKTFEEIASAYRPGEKIEVEEIFDDVFDIDEPGPDSKLMNGSIKEDNVKFSLDNEERQSLTKSVEDINRDPIA